ncbi:MAG: amidohydrolase [Saprospiraceae bacterium]|nr:amidohydrolase [Saprospiraceae bacterium]
MNISKINGHGHLLPEPHQIPKFMKDKKLFWIDDDKKYMRQGSWSRPITSQSFFLNEKLLWMKKNQIERSVILNLSQLYCNGMPLQDTIDVIRFQNDFNAQVQHLHPDNFTCGFVVQPLYIDKALEEIERCVKIHKLSLLCLPTHFLDKNEDWVSVADEQALPIFELANHYKLAIEIHPYDGPKMIKLKDQYWRFHLVWMMAQTADTLHLYTLKNFPNRFPNIRTCFAHGCMLGQANTGRRIQGYNGRPDLFLDTTNPSKTVGHPNIFFDTLVHDVYTFDLLKKRCGVTQIIAGIDDPYPLGEMEDVADSYPGKVIDEAVSYGIITKLDKEKIWYNNVIKWLG